MAVGRKTSDVKRTVSPPCDHFAPSFGEFLMCWKWVWFAAGVTLSHWTVLWSVGSVLWSVGTARARAITVMDECLLSATGYELETAVIGLPPQQGAACHFLVSDCAAYWRCWVAVLVAEQATAVKPYWGSAPWGKDKKQQQCVKHTSCVHTSGITGNADIEIKMLNNSYFCNVSEVKTYVFKLKPFILFFK